MRLTVIVVTWNSRGFLDRCLRSIPRSVNGSSVQIVVVDNASTDDSQALVRRYSPEVQLVANSVNLGFVRANNQALEYAKGDIVLFLNPDTEVVDGAIEKMVGCLADNPRVGVVGPLLLNSDGTFQQSFFSFPSFFSMLVEHAISARLALLLEAPRGNDLSPKRVDVIRGACLMIRTDLIRRIGGMNEKLFMYSEETDLCFKVCRLGFDVLFLPFARVIHHERRSVAGQSSSVTLYHYHRSKLIFIRENYSRLKGRVLISLFRLSLILKTVVYGLATRTRKRDTFRLLIRQLKEEGVW